VQIAIPVALKTPAQLLASHDWGIPQNPGVAVEGMHVQPWKLPWHVACPDTTDPSQPLSSQLAAWLHVDIEDVEEGVDRRDIVAVENVEVVIVVVMESGCARMDSAEANNAASSDCMPSSIAVTVVTLEEELEEELEDEDVEDDFVELLCSSFASSVNSSVRPARLPSSPVKAVTPSVPAMTPSTAVSKPPRVVATADTVLQKMKQRPARAVPRSLPKSFESTLDISRFRDACVYKLTDYRLYFSQSLRLRLQLLCFPDRRKRTHGGGNPLKACRKCICWYGGVGRA
jgi:hypothetical protein